VIHDMHGCTNLLIKSVYHRYTAAVGEFGEVSAEHLSSAHVGSSYILHMPPYQICNFDLIGVQRGCADDKYKR
jgi:hypothetical protein